LLLKRLATEQGLDVLVSVKETLKEYFAGDPAVERALKNFKLPDAAVKQKLKDFKLPDLPKVPAKPTRPAPKPEFVTGQDDRIE
jgi:hypothetical protein